MEFLNPGLQQIRHETRRHFLQSSGLGLGAMALQSLLAGEGLADRLPAANPLTPRQPMLAPRAKRVIYLHMAGSPSQLELFDDKPELKKLHLQDNKTNKGMAM